MAKATKREVEKVRMVEEKYTDIDGAVLELNHDELIILTALIGFQTSGGNKHVMNIYRALKDQINVYSHEVTGAVDKMSGMVRVEI